jgi:regulator of protease activity HflC (stomatin/prohibitin superfamily)
MIGIKFIKFQPNTYVMRYTNGKVVKEGAGLSFFYYAPTTSLVAIPTGSVETPFIFEEVTADYQAITIQGQVTYRISEPATIARLMNFTLAHDGVNYLSDDPKKLSQRIVSTIQVLTRKQVLALSLRDALKSADTIVEDVTAKLRENKEINSLGIEILSLLILAIRPNKDTARALEAEAREQILKEADDAIYLRRNASVEQERTIKENELNTEIAVENKKRQIREAQMEAEKSVQEKQHILLSDEMAFSIQQEEEKKKLVELSVQNAKSEAESRAYAISTAMKAFEGTDPAVIQSLANMGMQPDQLIAAAFQKLAQEADKIGQVNISPDLLRELMNKGE